MLVIEYDVLDSGLIELVALVNATDHDESDEDGRVWKAWRDGHPDGGFGYVAVPADILAEMEATETAPSAPAFRPVVKGAAARRAAQAGRFCCSMY